MVTPFFKPDLVPTNGTRVLVYAFGQLQFAAVMGSAIITEDSESIDGDALDAVEVTGVVTILYKWRCGVHKRQSGEVMFALEDVNSFYASCEAVFRSDLWAKPSFFHSNHPSAMHIARPCSQRGLNIRLVAALSTRALISGCLSHQPGA